MAKLTFLVFVLPFFLVEAETKRKIVEQQFENEHGVLLGPIGLGTPTQGMYMHLDTTTPSFFLIDGNCKTNGCTKNRKGFNTKKSSTFHELFQLPYYTSYSESKSSGRVVTDCLTALKIAKPRVPFPLVDRPNGNLTEAFGDGVLGLGFPAKGSLQMFTFFDLLTLLLDEPVFTWHMDYYNYTTTQGIHDSGLGTYGGNDLLNCEDDYQFFKTSKSDQWTLNLSEIKIGNTKLSAGEVLIRPGPQRLYGEKSEIDKILRILKAKKDSQLNEYVVDCNNVDNLPQIEFKINGVNSVHTFTAKDFIVKAQDQPQKCIVLFSVVDSKIGKSKWVFGDVLMRSRCLQFNIRKKMIGFAQPKNPSQS